jgi:hypothetical protein
MTFRRFCVSLMVFVALVTRRTIATTVYACQINSRNVSRVSTEALLFCYSTSIFVVNEDAC